MGICFLKYNLNCYIKYPHRTRKLYGFLSAEGIIFMKYYDYFGPPVWYDLSPLPESEEGVPGALAPPDVVPLVFPEVVPPGHVAEEVFWVVLPGAEDG